MLRSMVVGVESFSCKCIKHPPVGLILQGLSREQMKEMLDKYEVVVIRKRKN